MIEEMADYSNNKQDEAPGHQYQRTNEDRDEEIVQVVYQSDQHGALVGVESTSLLGSSAEFGGSVGETGNYVASNSVAPAEAVENQQEQANSVLIGSHHEQLSRAASTLPSVAEESTSSGGAGGQMVECANGDDYQEVGDKANVGPQDELLLTRQGTGPADFTQHPYGESTQHAPIYSTISRQPVAYAPTESQQVHLAHYLIEQQQQTENNSKNLIDYSSLSPSHNHLDQQEQQQPDQRTRGEDDQEDDPTRINQEIGHILSRHRGAGAVEKGSFRNNFRKKLGLSVSTNENDLTAYRQKFLETGGGQEAATQQLVGERASDVTTTPTTLTSATDVEQHHSSSGSRFKRTHSVSFNVNSSRSNRHSVDIRNLPSYLTHKRASIVDVARGAMSSLMSSLGSAGGGSGSGSAISGGGQRRDSYQDEEPIFEEPIAPTLSLGQRVAMVRNSGAEFGTVGWIGQLPEVDDDWIVGVIFDNMIGDCDGAYNGVRYFYARDHYAMFVPLSTLTKTDNYIGRPETGTMLSRMSVSLKPGQLISIQRSSIRLQHCFLNAPHQRVGHDVRAVSNRLHCQCHNCGPCAHLTKQGRISALPHFGSHHLPHRKKNSLAHAAVEMLAHHHHHFHEEEEDHEEKDYEFGDNAAHACNFVRYSCCQQSGQPGHEFSSDCGMVRPELLDNLIHAPKAPHRRSRDPRRGGQKKKHQQQRLAPGAATPAIKQQYRAGQLIGKAPLAIIEGDATAATNGESTMIDADAKTNTMTSKKSGELLVDSQQRQQEFNASQQEDDAESSYMSSRSSRSGSGSSSRSSDSPLRDPPEPYNYYPCDTSTYRSGGPPGIGVYNTIDSQISFMDQQRFVYKRDSAAFIQTPMPLNWSDDYDGSSVSATTTSYATPGLGFKRILRCLGCLRPKATTTCRRRRPRRKLSFRDRVLEYRRRQSTFVPSTLAKPHEDFASHGIILLHPTGGEINSDYSSCSHSSCSSSRSNSPPNYRPEQQADAFCLDSTIPMQTHEHQLTRSTRQATAYNNRQTGTMALEHGQPGPNDQLKSAQQHQPEHYRPQLNYGDFTFGDNYQNYKKTDLSRESALTDLAYFSDTYRSNSSSDTLKYLVDQSINEQVSLPQPLQLIGEADMVSPLSSSSPHNGCGKKERDSPSEQVDISSLTASVMDEQENARRELEDLSLGANEDNVVEASEQSE